MGDGSIDVDILDVDMGYLVTLARGRTTLSGTWRAMVGAKPLYTDAIPSCRTVFWMQSNVPLYGICPLASDSQGLTLVHFCSST
jgi:hypothetical protein